ncbi:MAG TPA: TetR/AcrR family transcriptional regulator [Deltaproteobacteria bacterium]|nr:TetR/AcrR family transcriptional regulator [Deltaproteobacteria bacterium]
MGREEKLTRIYETALKMFAQYGYKRTRVEDIAHDLGMTKGNLYLYVKDKRDLYEKVVSHGLLHWQNQVFESISKKEDVVDQFVTLCQKSFSYLEKDVPLRTVLMNDPSIFPLSRKEDHFSEINRFSMDMLRSLLRKGIREGKFRDVDVNRVTDLLFSIYVMFIIRTYIQSEGRSIKKMFEQMIDIVLNGLLKKD